ncbi:MAG: glycoside hydrolase family 15 protein [Rhodospirillaceae bacterium]|nr:glycoside hydrolase family 15 protein [Rhodospirillaceae bacterium]
MDRKSQLRIEDYAMIGSTRTAALVGLNGSIDWLCLPRFDSAACFAALLGRVENGRWLIAPHDEARSRQAYRGDTMVLETVFETADGSVSLIDFMPPHEADDDGDREDLVRLVVGRHGTVRMRMDLVLRFDYGRIKPWVRRAADGITAVAGPDAVQIVTPVELTGEDFHTLANFSVSEGQVVPFTLIWRPSHRPPHEARDPQRLQAATEAWWRRWSTVYEGRGPWRDAVMRSLLTLKALTYAPTGGIVAAATTSLPEDIGGVRNWDYRYCWLRDATLTLYALLSSGYEAEARDWRNWLLRAVAGEPKEIQIMYGLAGERRIEELELPWLAGYEDSRPVRIGNAAHGQLQLDVLGEVMDVFHTARRRGLEPDHEAWRVQKVLMEFLEARWSDPDSGIWEVRGPERHFTHSKVMAWVAVDRAIKAVEQHGYDGPVEHWRMLRQRIHDDVCRNGFNTERGTFVQHYGGTALDAALLLIPCVGFLPPEDPRVCATVEAIQRELVEDGLVLRYRPNADVEGVAGREGTFLACSLWLADALQMMGRHDEAEAMFERVLSLRNHVGLLAEEYDTARGRLCGNFPQAFSHIGIINTAHNLEPAKRGPARRTAGGEPERAAATPAP